MGYLLGEFDFENQIGLEYVEDVCSNQEGIDAIVKAVKVLVTAPTPEAQSGFMRTIQDLDHRVQAIYSVDNYVILSCHFGGGGVQQYQRGVAIRDIHYRNLMDQC